MICFASGLKACGSKLLAYAQCMVKNAAIAAGNQAEKGSCALLVEAAKIKITPDILSFVSIYCAMRMREANC